MTDSGSWETRLFALFDDLEQQAEAAWALERDLEVGERARAEYAAVTLDARLMASVGSEVRLGVTGAGRLEGLLERVATGWCLLAGTRGEWVVLLDAVATVDGASPRAVPHEAWTAAANVGVGSALRRLAEAGEPVRVVLRDGTAYEGRVGRVGADFLEVLPARGTPQLLGYAALAALHSPRR